MSPTIRVAAIVPSALLLGVLTPAWPAAQGRIEGQVLNGTNNRPVPNQVVQLLLPRGGMQQVATVSSDATGHFTFVRSEIDPGSFYLLQAVFQGVNYHEPVQFDSQGNATVSVSVYESTRSAVPLRIRSARILIRAEGTKVRVQELYAFQNLSQPPRAYTNPDGTFEFVLSPDAGEPTVAVAGLMDMPLPQVVQTGKSPGQFSINYALKPGSTVVMVGYDADYASGGLALSDRVPYPIDQVELYVSPPDLAVDSPLFKPAGLDSETGGKKYVAEGLKAGTPLEARLSGEAAPGAPSESGQAAEEIRPGPNSLTRLGVPLLFCMLLVLFWALGVRVAKEWPKWKEQAGASPAQKQLEPEVEALFNSLVDLDELFASGKIAEKSYWKERLELKAKLVAILKKGPDALLESYASRHNPR